MREVSPIVRLDSQIVSFDIESVRLNGLQSMKGITEDSKDQATFVLIMRLRKNFVVWIDANACMLSKVEQAKVIQVGR